MIRIVTPALLILLLTTQPVQAQTPPPDWTRAKSIYDTNCAACHGPEGTGGKGPALAVPKLPRAPTDDQLAAIIGNGIPGTVMPPSWHLGPDGIMLATAYVRKLSANSTQPAVEGDTAKGQALFESKGRCGNCHNFGYGPNLSSIGARRTAASLLQSIVDPAAEVSEDFLLTRLQTRDGKTIQGIRVNEDSFTIQIVAPSGQFSSFRKDALAKLERRSGETTMPSYKTAFSADELKDLVAYLSSLRGEQ